MQFQRDEVPTGDIDGVNMTYTLAYTPAVITAVYVNGAYYTTYTISGTTLTLEDAPTDTLTVSYWDTTGGTSPTGGGIGGSTLAELLTAQEDYLGFSERNRLTTPKRIAAINTSLGIVYDFLSASSIIKATNAVTLTDDVAFLPSDFGEGTVLLLGNASTFDASDKVPELTPQEFGRLNTSDEYFMQSFDSATGLPIIETNGLSDGVYYIEYEKGGPTLANTGDYDGIPRWTKNATAKLSASILTQNLLKDDTKMLIALYGPTGNKAAYSPDSVFGIIQRGLKRRRLNAQRSNPMQITILEPNKNRRRFYR